MPSFFAGPHIAAGSSHSYGWKLTVKPGSGPNFERAMADGGTALIGAAPGCHSASVGRGIEKPDVYLLLLRWDAVDDHVRFTKTPEFARFSELVGPYLAAAPDALHFEILD